MRKITCTIITKNEEDRIFKCLLSVQGIVDEIIVVDSGSDDKTLTIAKNFDAICYTNPWEGFGQQKRFAEDKAKNDWILNLDADEWLSDFARAEIQDLIAKDDDDGIYGYRFNIKNIYPGDTKPRILADQHKYIRLYNKKYCRFPESAAFDEIKLNKKNVRKMSSPIYHRSIRSISHLIEKNIFYYKIQREEIKKSVLISVPRLFFEPFIVFLKYYFLKRHITGGIYGFIIASTIALLRMYRLAILISSRKIL